MKREIISVCKEYIFYLPHSIVGFIVITIFISIGNGYENFRSSLQEYISLKGLFLFSIMWLYFLFMLILAVWIIRKIYKHT